MKEFIDAYSDDLIYLKEGRQALLTHPLRREIKELCSASYCRMLAIIMIGSIETMFLEWKKQDKIGILDTWFAEKDGSGKKITNERRVLVLYDAFRQAGIDVDKEVFDDFLAIKYLRNTIVHGKWKDHERIWLEKRGFPTDTRSLRQSHWQRMQSVNNNMMLYIALTSIAIKPVATHPRSTGTIRLPEVHPTEVAGLVTEQDLPSIFWLNLERIGECIYTAVEQSVLTGQYYWAKDLCKEAMDQLSDLERKRLFYEAARKAGKGAIDILVKHKDLCKEALYSWREYRRLTFDRLQLPQDAIARATGIINALHSKSAYFESPSVPWNRTMPTKVAEEMVRFLLKGYEPIPEHEIVTALSVGQSVYDIMPNIVPVYVLNVLLPIVDPTNTRTYLEAGDDALTAMGLHVSWYWYVEYKRPPVDENLKLYTELQHEFAADP